MYRAYLRTFDGQVSEKTNTPDRAAAALAFSALVNRSELDGQKLAVALTYQNRQVAFHRFDRKPGSPDYWRGRLDEIPWPDDPSTDLAQEPPAALPFTIADRSPAECRRLRGDRTLQAMADIARYSGRSKWFDIESGTKGIDPLRWEWCLLMLGEHPTLRLAVAVRS